MGLKNTDNKKNWGGGVHCKEPFVQRKEPSMPIRTLIFKSVLLTAFKQVSLYRVYVSLLHKNRHLTTLCTPYLWCVCCFHTGYPVTSFLLLWHYWKKQGKYQKKVTMFANKYFLYLILKTSRNKAKATLIFINKQTASKWMRLMLCYL